MKDSSLVKKVKMIVRMYKSGILIARDTEDDTTSHEVDNFVQISQAVLADKRFGNKGIYRYDIDLQTCFVFKEDDVVVMAPYGKRLHLFYCEWDETFEGHLPIYFLGSYKK